MGGALATAHISQLFGPLRRSVLSLNFLSQALCILVAAIITTVHAIPTNNRDEGPGILDNPKIIGALPALAFESGATIATSRLLGYGNVIPVNVFTSTYAALATDMRLFARDNVDRNRRVGAVVCVLLGALCAAWIQNKGPGIELVLWLCVAVKGVIAVCVFLFLAPKEGGG